MGVTHKLNQEVIDYIVDQKQQNPKLGCRKLAELTSEKFDTKVSKSSVNTILKNAELSNSVGRPSKKIEDKAKKFQIPSIKKQQISKELHNIPIPKEEKPQNKEQLSNLTASPNLKQDILDIPSPKQNTKKVKKLSVVFSSDDVNPKIINVENAGAIFLKASFWESLDSSILGTLLQRYNISLEKGDFDKVCSQALTMLACRLGNLDNISSGFQKMLECLDGAKDYESAETLLSKEISDSDLKDLFMRMELELQQMHNLAGYVRIVFNNGKNVYLDPHLLGVNSQKPENVRGVPLKSTLDILSEFLITNNKPVILTNICVHDDSFYDLVGFYENIENFQASAIIVEGLNGEILAKFSILPTKRRFFAMRMNQENTEYIQAEKSSQWATKDRFESRYNGTTYEYCSVQANFLSKHFKTVNKDINVLSVWNEGTDKPLLSILTNMSCDFKELIDTFLYINQHTVSNEDKNTNELNDQMNIRDVMGKNGRNVTVKTAMEPILSHLECFMLDQYFDMKNLGSSKSDILPRVYNIPGELVIGKHKLIVNLRVPDDKELIDLVKKAINNMKKRKIITFNKQYLEINI